MNHTCYKGSYERCVPLKGSIQNADTIRLRYTDVSASPLVMDGNLVLAKADKSLQWISMESDTTIWKLSFSKAIRELFQTGNLLFASDGGTLYAIHLEDGLLIKEFADINPSLLFAVVANNALVFPSFKEGSRLCSIQLSKLEWKDPMALEGLADFSLKYHEHFIINEAPNFLKCIDPENGRELWKVDVLKDTVQGSFVNEVPFVKDGKVFVTVFPDRILNIDIQTGTVHWNKTFGTGMNTFSVPDFEENTLWALSGNTLLEIDRSTGAIISKVSIPLEGNFKLSHSGSDALIAYSSHKNEVISLQKRSNTFQRLLNLKDGATLPPIIANGRLVVLDKKNNLYF
ncbi:PQQ-binding-like beta-propeller repeat protein [Aureisphaera galaxeae]|uniref:outer membrane protein assembly factor BamB family protein n=1 Tax=Aureisphaera galaxeae TaxID=1538023 RepID=UPI00235011BD|nr:PQQ-binding-like beta-propeller repeat protein [Aureisphaera galaxeae]MDC8005371.1 PQQ-binding-like beta-propeller repeat protein [Aureisphaera galaxeae]